MEDDDSNYHRTAVVPTLTLKIPNANHALEFYGMLDRIYDVDEYEDFDEDGHSRGGGIAYLVYSKTRSYFRVLSDYRHTYYDSRGWDYINTTTPDKRHDVLMSASAEHNIQLTDVCDLNLNYTYVHTHSNVKIYDYDKHILQAGVSVKF
jgi:hypothetical protein